MIDELLIPGLGRIEATIVDVSNPMVLVRAEDIGMKGIELPEEINGNARVCEILEKIRGNIGSSDARRAEDPDGRVPDQLLPRLYDVKYKKILKKPLKYL